MNCNDFVVVISLVLVGSFLMIARSTRGKRSDSPERGQSCPMAVRSTQVPMQKPSEGFSAPQRGRRFQPSANNVRERMESATTVDASNPMNLMPDAESTAGMDNEWKEMFGHAENTLAQENFIEPSYEYAIGALNVPKKWLTQDLRGAPECPQYDNLTPFNNSPFANLDLTEKWTRRAGDL